MTSVRVYDLKTGPLPTRFADLQVDGPAGPARFITKSAATEHALANPSTDAFRAVLELKDGFALASGHDPSDFLSSVDAHGFRTNDPVRAIITQGGEIGGRYGHLSPVRRGADAFASSPVGRRVLRNPTVANLLVMAGIASMGLAVVTVPTAALLGALYLHDRAK